MEPRRVILEDGGKEVGWACGKCGNFYSNLSFGGAAQAGRDISEVCCAPEMCCQCKANVRGKYLMLCDRCAAENAANKFKDAWDIAKKVKQSEYHGEMVYRDGIGTDGYCPTEDASTECWDQDLDYWAYATEEREFRLDASEIVNDALEHQQYYDGAIDKVASADMARLQTFLDKWCASVGIKGFWPDESTIVLLNKCEDDVSDEHDETDESAHVSEANPTHDAPIPS